MNLFSVNAVTDHVEADLLSRLNRRVNLFEFVRRASAYHRSAEVAKVAGFLRTRENVEDDRRVRFDGARAFVVRIDALVAGRDDRVAGKPPLSHDRGVDDSLQCFGSQSSAIEMEVAVASGFGSFKRANAGLETQSRDAERFGDMFNLVRGFGFAFSEEWIPFDLDAKPLRSELVGEQRGKIGRDDERTDAALAEEQIKNVRHPRARFSRPPEFFLVLRQRKHPIHTSLFLGPVDLQIAHHDVFGFLVLEENKRIRHKEPRGVEHVCVAFAGGN